MAEHCKISVATIGDGEKKSHAILETRSHVIKIDGYSRCKKVLKSGECVTSEPFTSGSLNWVMEFYPNGYEPTESIAVYLFPDPHDDDGDVDVKAKFSLLDKDGVRVPLVNGTYCWQKSPTDQLLGFSNFIVEGSSYIRDDSFSIRCDITITEDIGSAETKGDQFVAVPPSNLHLHLGDLLKNMDGADVNFQVGGQKFSAHRYVLAARSSVFKAELLGDMKEKAGGPIEISDMEASVFKSLLHFVYTDSVPVLEMDSNVGEAHEDVVMAGHLLVAADWYNIGRLKLICEHRLCGNIDANMVATSLALAEQHSCHGLKEACLQFLASPSNVQAMMTSDGYEHLKSSCPSVLKELVARFLPTELKGVLMSI